MKSGASDPFADDDSSVTEPRENQTNTSSSSDTSAASSNSESGSGKASSSDTPVSNTGQFNRSDLPYVLRRDKVKDERDNVHQLFVQSDTDETEKDARRELKDRFEDSVYKLDAREAIYLAGMQNLGDAEHILREWGYDL